MSRFMYLQKLLKRVDMEDSNPTKASLVIKPEWNDQYDVD